MDDQSSLLALSLMSKRLSIAVEPFLYRYPILKSTNANDGNPPRVLLATLKQKPHLRQYVQGLEFWDDRRMVAPGQVVSLQESDRIRQIQNNGNVFLAPSGSISPARAYPTLTQVAAAMIPRPIFDPRHNPCLVFCTVANVCSTITKLIVQSFIPTVGNMVGGFNVPMHGLYLDTDETFLWPYHNLTWLTLKASVNTAGSPVSARLLDGVASLPNLKVFEFLDYKNWVNGHPRWRTRPGSSPIERLLLDDVYIFSRSLARLMGSMRSPRVITYKPAHQHTLRYVNLLLRLRNLYRCRPSLEAFELDINSVNTMVNPPVGADFLDFSGFQHLVRLKIPYWLLVPRSTTDINTAVAQFRAHCPPNIPKEKFDIYVVGTTRYQDTVDPNRTLARFQAVINGLPN